MLQVTLRRLLTVAALSGAAFSQDRPQPQPLTGPVHNAGTYHVSTGTWTRGTGSTALAGPDVLYDNTCLTGFSQTVPQGQVLLDSGRVPSTTSPTNSTSLTGTYCAYESNGFEIGYISGEPLTTDLAVSFYDCYEACDAAGPSVPTPDVTIALVGMPAATPAHPTGSWIVSIDLDNTTFVFSLGGDCTGFYDGVASTDSFSWSWQQTTPTTGQDPALLLAGDPLGLFNISCGGIGAGTTFPTAGPGPGTGIGTPDAFQLLNGPVVCSTFGGYSASNPFSSFYLRLDGGNFSATTGCGALAGDAYCFGDGTGAACPCGNTGSPGQGCANSSGAGAVLIASGNASITADTLGFFVSGVPGSKPGLLVRGDNQISTPAGDGILCTAGGSQRSQVQVTDAGGSSMFTDFNGGPFGSVSIPGVPTNFQFWYRDPQFVCTGGGFNFSNGWTVTFQP